MSSLSQSKDRWWESLPYDDPITLEPICSLAFPPFSLQGNYFDPVALSAYIVTRFKFENPLTRQPISAEECVTLDEHVSRHCSSFRWSPDAPSTRVSVKDAYLLYSNVKCPVPGSSSSSSSSAAAASADASRQLDVLRSTAALVLQGLFRYDAWRPPAAAATAGEEAYYRVIDDFDVVAKAADLAHAASVEGEFPAFLPPELVVRALRETAAAAARLGDVRAHVSACADKRVGERRALAARATRQAESDRQEREERERERAKARAHHAVRIEGLKKREEEDDKRAAEAKEEIERWR